MSEVDVGPVEGWPDDSLRQTIDGSYGLGSDAGLPPKIRFLIGVVRLIRIRQEKIAAEPGEDLPAVFFFSPQLPDSLEALQLQRSPMLNNGLTPLGDRFWFVGPLGNYGRALDLHGWSDDAEVFDRAGELGIDGLPAVLLDNRHNPPELRHFPKGLGDPEIAEVVSLGGRDISIEEVLGHVRKAHETNMKTPKLIPRDLKLWQNASNHRPVKQAEKRIQTILRIALAAAMPATVIHEEPNVPVGRIDLEIQEYRGGGVMISHALLELKVLRSYGSTGKPVSAAKVKKVIAEGISQAAAYRDDHETKAAALCCFDMRKSESGEQCFATVREPAEKKKIALGVYYLFASAGRSRPKIKAAS